MGFPDPDEGRPRHHRFHQAYRRATRGALGDVGTCDPVLQAISPGGRMKSLEASIVPVRTLAAIDCEKMYSLFEQYYECVTFDRFLSDLRKKDDVIVLRDDDGDIQGFSTLKKISVNVRGRNVRGVFS